MGKLFSVPPGFDLSIAGEAAALVQNAYDQFQQGANWKIKPGYDELERLRARPAGSIKDEMFGFVARNQASRDVFVTFRGTQSVEDWLSNLTFPQVTHSGGWGKVEQGFSQLYDQCAGALVRAVQGAGAARVFVTGHSLGGALATLATADLLIEKIDASMYSFAAPRTGNRAFADRFDAAAKGAWRVANTEDLVTTVPLATLVLETTKANMLHTIAALASHLGHALDFEHVGVPVNFTAHNGSVSGNHGMQTYAAALS